jgi:hypothetical protein
METTLSWLVIVAFAYLIGRSNGWSEGFNSAMYSDYDKLDE